jgi:hypothetical protein
MMPDQSPDRDPVTPNIPNATPDTTILDRRIDAAFGRRGFGKDGGGGHIGGMADDERLQKLENEVHAIKGALDWAKITFSILIAVVLGGITLLVSLNLKTSSQVDALSDKITNEFRIQRAEMSAQVSAIANAITATKQQAPQVIILPVSAVHEPSNPSPVPSPSIAPPSPTPTPPGK